MFSREEVISDTVVHRLDMHHALEGQLFVLLHSLIWYDLPHIAVTNFFLFYFPVTAANHKYHPDLHGELILLLVCWIYPYACTSRPTSRGHDWQLKWDSGNWESANCESAKWESANWDSANWVDHCWQTPIISPIMYDSANHQFSRGKKVSQHMAQNLFLPFCNHSPAIPSPYPSPILHTHIFPHRLFQPVLPYSSSLP